jgi:hypothetical protein
LSLRAFAAHVLGNGHGEWEGEIAYSSNHDDSAGKVCGDITTCFGASRSSILSLGGNVFYRINRNWFVMGSLFLNRTSITHVDMTASTEDPTVTGVTGYIRIAYRF